MKTALCVALGGGAGALLRYAAQRAFAKRMGHPRAGTLLVNLAGSFAFGLLMGVPVAAENRDVVLLGGIGFLGGLTMFSAVMAQLTELLGARRRKAAAVYGLATFGCGLLLAAAGFTVGRWI